MWDLTKQIADVKSAAGINLEPRSGSQLLGLELSILNTCGLGIWAKPFN